MEFKLLEIIPGNSTHGNLPKALYHCLNNGQNYIVKGATYQGYQPFAEYMADKLLQSLDFCEYIHYFLLPSSMFPGVRWNCTHVSICQLYKDQQLTWISVQEFMISRRLTDSSNLLASTYGQVLLGKIASFDFLIGNNDRHLGNLALLVSSNAVIPAPLFDHGEGFFSPYDNYTQINLYRKFLPNAKLTILPTYHELSSIISTTTLTKAIADMNDRLDVLRCY